MSESENAIEPPPPSRNTRDWTLRRVYAWHLAPGLAAGVFYFLLHQHIGDFRIGFDVGSFSKSYLLASVAILFVTILVWAFWLLFVNFLFLHAARKITITHSDRGPRINIKTTLSLQSTITPDQILRVRTSWARAGHISVHYRTDSLLWRIIRALALMPNLVISRQQFPEELSWLSFVNSLDENQVPVSSSTYPPTYPEVPCPTCGLKVPTYEATCPNCATPRVAANH